MKAQKLNYDFSIRDINSTKQNHYKQILKLTAKKDLLIKMIIQLDENNESEIWQSDIFRGYSYYYSILEQFRKEKKQSQLKTLKSAINDVTKNHIVWLLEYNELPKSYSTAFYCIFYARINRLMKSNLKAIS